MKKIFVTILLISIYKVSICQQTKISYETFAGFEDPNIKSKLDSAIIILEEIVNDPLFDNEVLHTKFLRKKNKTKKQILDLIKCGQEEDTPVDNVINLKLMVYESAKNEVGHTDGGDTIHTHRGYILENSASCYAAHLLHEYCHVLGFRHAFLRMPLRFMTVPYRIGTIVSKLKHTYCP